MKFYNSPIEDKAVELINSCFENPEIVNPCNYSSKDMDFYCELVEDCDVLVFQELADGVLSSGVWKEIEKAFEIDTSVYLLDVENGDITKICSLETFDCLNVTETRLAYILGKDRVNEALKDDE